MDNITIQVAIIAASSALLGSFVAGLIQITTISIQARAERRRELLRLGVEAGITEYRGRLEATMREGGAVPPAWLCIYQASEAIRLMAAGELTPKAYKLVSTEVQALADELEGLDKDRTEERAK